MNIIEQHLIYKGRRSLKQKLLRGWCDNHESKGIRQWQIN